MVLDKNEVEKLMSEDKLDMADFLFSDFDDIFDKTSYYSMYKDALIKEGYWTWERVHYPDKKWGLIENIYTHQKTKVINFSSMSYLGINFHPILIERCKKAIEKYGLSSTSAAMLDGITDLHLKAEARLAEFLGFEDSILFSSGYACMLGTTQGLLLNPKAAVVYDEYSHSSLQDGIKLASARRYIYKHNDLNDLEQKLIQASKHSQKLLLTEGVFSIVGDIPEIAKIISLAKKYNFRVMIDDAHGIGVLGKTGKGIIEEFSLKDVDIYSAVLSKAFGLTGGFTCSKKSVTDFLRLYSNPVIASSNVSPVFCEGILAVIDILESEPNHIKDLSNNIVYMRKMLADLNFPLEKAAVPIFCIPIGDATKLRKVSRFFYDNSILIHPIPYPRAPKGRGCIRFCLNANNTKEEIDIFIQILKIANDKFSLFNDGLFQVDRDEVHV